MSDITRTAPSPRPRWPRRAVGLVLGAAVLLAAGAVATRPVARAAGGVIPGPGAGAHSPAGVIADMPTDPATTSAGTRQGTISTSTTPSDDRPPASTSSTSVPSTSVLSTGAPVTQTLGVAATTVTPQTIATSSAAVGEEQTVVFAGFQPGETVGVTLYSQSIPLDPVTADDDGVATITFTVPPDLPLGQHLIEAVGQESGVTGIAQFAVGAVPVTTSATESTTTAPAPSAAAPGGGPADDASDTSAPVTAADGTAADDTAGADEGAQGAAPETVTTVRDGGAAVLNTAETQLAETAGSTPTTAGLSSETVRLIWLLVVFAVLIVLAGSTAVVVLMRHRGGGR